MTESDIYSINGYLSCLFKSPSPFTLQVRTSPINTSLVSKFPVIVKLFEKTKDVNKKNI